MKRKELRPGASAAVRVPFRGGGLRRHAFPGCRGPLDGGDDLVAPDGVGEVRHGVSPVVDVRGERRLGTPYVAGGRSFEARERGPPLRRCRGGWKLGRLVTSLCSCDGQGKDLRL